MGALGKRVEHVQRVEGHVAVSARAAFAGLWSGINGAESWLENPLVWRVEFRKVEVVS
jgi:hypothetical protein